MLYTTKAKETGLSWRTLYKLEKCLIALFVDERSSVLAGGARAVF